MFIVFVSARKIQLHSDAGQTEAKTNNICAEYFAIKPNQHHDMATANIRTKPALHKSVDQTAVATTVSDNLALYDDDEFLLLNPNLSTASHFNRISSTVRNDLCSCIS